MKMQRKQIPFEEVYDLFAIRIVFKPLPFRRKKTQCYQIYATITDIYTPKPDRLRDWINTPKANGYEALHSTVMSPDGVWVEVQIRTQRMDDIAERGVAAHWKYKQETISQNEDELDKWLKKIRDALNSPTENAVDFLDNFKLSSHTSEIVVFTPKGEPRRLPFGATALDFAYDIHTNVGNKAIGAKINHKLEPVTTQISSGDQIEIITADNARPKAEWLDLVTTSKAKQSIKNFLKREQQNNIERGMATLTERLAKLNINLSGRVLRKLVPAYECATKEEFLQQNRCRHHPAGRYREASESQLGEQDPEILDAVHPQKGEAGERGRRNAGDRRGGGRHVAGIRRRRVLQTHSGRQGHWSSAIRSRARSSSTRPPCEELEPARIAVRAQHHQGRDQVVAAQGRLPTFRPSSCAVSTARAFCWIWPMSSAAISASTSAK